MRCKMLEKFKIIKEQENQQMAHRNNETLRKYDPPRISATTTKIIQR